MSKRLDISQKTINEMWVLHDQGYGYHRLSKIYGYSHHTIRQRFIENSFIDGKMAKTPLTDRRVNSPVSFLLLAVLAQCLIDMKYGNAGQKKRSKEWIRNNIDIVVDVLQIKPSYQSHQFKKVDYQKISALLK